MSTPRDFAGYRGNYPVLRWPGDTGLAVSFVLNVEEGAEFALSAGDARNESRHEVNHEVVGAVRYSRIGRVRWFLYCAAVCADSVAYR